MKTGVIVSIAFVAISAMTCQGSRTGKGEPYNNTYTTEELRAELGAINGAIARHVVLEQTDSLVARYAADFAYMPEFKPAIGNVASLTDFYNQWFGMVANNHYRKKIYLVEAYGDHVLEIGDFTLGYASGQGQERMYNGNYFILWRRDNRGQLKVRAEIFGSNTYLTAADVPYADVIVADSGVLETSHVSDALRSNLETYDSALVASIEQGDGQARASGFHPEGLYIPHFSLRLEGMDALLPYLVGIYRPESKLYTRNTYQEVFDLGEVVFLTGHFTGGWGDAATGGTFQGNMANLLKRNESGKLLMYRQMVNNDQ